MLVVDAGFLCIAWNEGQGYMHACLAIYNPVVPDALACLNKSEFPVVSCVNEHPNLAYNTSGWSWIPPVVVNG